MTATLETDPTATLEADAPAVPLELATYAVGSFVIGPFVPGAYTPVGPRAQPDQSRQRACLSLVFRLTRPDLFDALRAGVVRETAAAFDAIRRGFSTDPAWLKVTALESRLADHAADKTAAEARAKSEAAKVRTAIVKGDRAAEADAAAGVTAAEGEAADAANRSRIVSDALPAVRSTALEALRALLAAEREKRQTAAAAEAQRAAGELTEAVAELVAELVAANVAAGAASNDPGACSAYDGRHWSEYCSLPR